jgi:hypothetical protein
VIASLTDFDKILRKLCRASANLPVRNAGDPAPCSQLVEDIIAQGERFVERHTRVPGPNEYRLNGDELKLHYEVEFYRDGEATNVYVASVRIGGKQTANYPEFVRVATAIVESSGTSTGNSAPATEAA